MNYVLRIVGWVTLAAGFFWAVISAWNGGGWLVFLFWAVLTCILSVLLFGLSEAVDLLIEQQSAWERIEERLRELPVEKNICEKKPQLCNRCGTPLPPGGHTCPTCHHDNR